MRNFCKANKISASALTSAAFALTVGTYTNQQESLFATIYHGMIKTTSELCGKPCAEENLDANTTGNPLEVELMSVADGMKIYIEYNSTRYSEKFIDAFNATEVDYDKSRTVVSLFETAAKKFPDNTAVIFGEKKFSYREVDALSNDIAAYVVGAEKISIDELNKFIAERKPPYMVPAVTLQIDSIPLNQNGKVNRRALPKPEVTAEEKTAAPRSPNVLEKILLEVVGKILGVKEFDFATELTYLGLSSISAIKLSTQLYKKFGVNIPVKKLLSGTLETIENELLMFLLSDKKSSEQTVVAVSSIRIGNVQRGIYLECMKNPLSTAYNVPFIYNFEANTDVATLSDAVKKILVA